METSHGVTWRLHALRQNTRRALDMLAKASWLKKSDWYLAGGTALALHMGHRTSVDLDFFTPKNDFAAGKLIDRFPKKMWNTTVVREGTVYGELFGAKISFIAYPFFVPARPYYWYGMVRILDPHDIAVMKIIAISQRGKKRDFFDLYWYCQHREPLSALMACLEKQYPTVQHNYHHIFTSLTYFADAEDDVIPKLFFKTSWKEVKKFFETETPKAVREFLK